MTVTLAAESHAEPAAPRRWVGLLLLSVAVIESLSALTGVPVLFGDLSDVPGPGPAGWVITATLVVRPVAAVAAFLFALRGWRRHAIYALAVAALVNWLSFLPSVMLHGLGFEGSGSLISSAHFLFSPLPALAAVLLAWKDPQRLGLPAVLVSLPTIVDMLGTLAFAIAVAIYGF